MADKSPPQKKQQSKRQGILQEAWQNMMNDMDRVLPEKLHGAQGKKKFVLWLFVLDVITSYSIHYTKLYDGLRTARPG